MNGLFTSCCHGVSLAARALSLSLSQVHLSELGDGEAQREDFALLAKLNCTEETTLIFLWGNLN